jgi:hypothetical protein
MGAREVAADDPRLAIIGEVFVNLFLPGVILGEAPVSTVPTITLEGDANGAPHPEFAGHYTDRPCQSGCRRRC